MTSRRLGHPLAPTRGPGPHAAADGDPVYHSSRGDGAYARLLAAMRRMTDLEPDATFANEDVLVEGEHLVQLLRDRVSQATGRYLAPADAETS